MSQTYRTRLLNTRLGAALALAFTAFCFVLTILRWNHATSGWLFTRGVIRPGWLPVTLNIFFYTYFCLLGFHLVRGAKDQERVFIVGWFAVILLSPLAALHPQWTITIKFIVAFGEAAALLASLSLLLKLSSESAK